MCGNDESVCTFTIWFYKFNAHFHSCSSLFCFRVWLQNANIPFSLKALRFPPPVSLGWGKAHPQPGFLQRPVHRKTPIKQTQKGWNFLCICCICHCLISFYLFFLMSCYFSKHAKYVSHGIKSNMKKIVKNNLLSDSNDKQNFWYLKLLIISPV